MIFGCPNQFAIYYDKVDCWSSDGFDEGLIGFYINGHLFPKDMSNHVSTLYTNMIDFRDCVLEEPLINEKLFYEKKLSLCKYLLKKRYPAVIFNSQDEFDDYPDDLYEEEELTNSMEIDFLSRARLVVFLIQNHLKVRILMLSSSRNDEEDFFNLNNLVDNDIVETIVSLDEFKTIMNDAIKWMSRPTVVCQEGVTSNDN